MYRNSANDHRQKIYTPGGAEATGYSVQELKDIKVALNRKLGPEFISKRSGPGCNVQYLEGWKAINLANEIFGPNGWNTELKEFKVDYIEEKNSMINLGLSCIVRVILKDGTFHEDVGYGSIERCRSKAMAFDKCKKEAVTDGMKRALRQFGNALGNCLYDKDFLKQITKVTSEPSDFDEHSLMRRSKTNQNTLSTTEVKLESSSGLASNQVLAFQETSRTNENRSANNRNSDNLNVRKVDRNNHIAGNNRGTASNVKNTNNMGAYSETKSDTGYITGKQTSNPVSVNNVQTASAVMIPSEAKSNMGNYSPGTEFADDFMFSDELTGEEIEKGLITNNYRQNAQEDNADSNSASPLPQSDIEIDDAGPDQEEFASESTRLGNNNNVERDIGSSGANSTVRVNDTPAGETIPTEVVFVSAVSADTVQKNPNAQNELKYDTANTSTEITKSSFINHSKSLPVKKSQIKPATADHDAIKDNSFYRSNNNISSTSKGLQTRVVGSNSSSTTNSKPLTHVVGNTGINSSAPNPIVKRSFGLPPGKLSNKRLRK